MEILWKCTDDEFRNFDRKNKEFCFRDLRKTDRNFTTKIDIAILATRDRARVPSRFSACVLVGSPFRERQRQATSKCISVIFQAIEHLLVARNGEEEKARTGTAAATVGKRRPSLASLSAARDAKWRSHWIPWDKESGRAGRGAGGFVFTIELELPWIPREGYIRVIVWPIKL